MPGSCCAPPANRACGCATSRASLGITERSAYGIVTDLTEAGYVVKQEDGRRSCYQIQAHLPLPETTSRQHAIGEVPALLAGTSARLPVTRTRPARGHRSRAACTHPGRRPAPGQPGPPYPARGPARSES
ncbi:MAG: hypothetical protein ACRDPF_27845 [Streptosporangiaceae bacterium]